MKNIYVLGSGYVGLVTGGCFAELGHQVTCVDIDAGKVERLSKGIHRFTRGIVRSLRPLLALLRPRQGIGVRARLRVAARLGRRRHLAVRRRPVPLPPGCDADPPDPPARGNCDS